MAIELPIDAFLPEISEQLLNSNALVLTADPGAGKTTRVPPELTRQLQGQILVLEPRRIAAISSAQRVAEENGWKLGEEVGYWVRHDPKFNSNTRLVFLTEALLTRRLLSDPNLKGVSAVILDEFHERSIHCDLAIGLLKELQSLERPDLKIMVMSATIEAETVAHFLDQAPVLKVPGRLFPMDIRLDKSSQLLNTGPQFVEKVVGKIQEASVSKNSGDILVFLPGVGEIERVRRSLISFPGEVVALHGRLEPQEQKAVLAPRAAKAPRRVILATNVAESALTIDGVSIVIDSGLERLSRLHPKTMHPSLMLQRISKASATQRAGRSARQSEGLVYRLWNSLDERSMPNHVPAEIFREDLCSTLLFLAKLGVSDFQKFSWFEHPLAHQIFHASNELLGLGALQKTASGFEITELGKKMLELPLHPRYARVLLESVNLNFSYWGARFAVLLQEKAGVDRNGGSRSHTEEENDLIAAYERWQKDGHRQLDRALAQVESFAKTERKNQNYDHTSAQELFLRCFPGNICRRRGSTQKAVMTGGRGVSLAPESQVQKSEFFIALDFFEKEQGADSSVGVAIGLTDDFVKAHIGKESVRGRTIRWDDERNDFFAFEGQSWRGLALDSGHRTPPKPEEVFEILVAHAIENWSRLLELNISLKAWMSRYARWKNSVSPEFPLSLKDFPTEQLREWIEGVSYGENSWKTLCEKDWIPFLESHLNAEDLKAMNQFAPRQILLPSGRSVSIEYPEDKGPYIEVKMQELFGLADSPMVMGQKLTFHMLGPNFRPVQITSDLAGFWKSSYLEIRKELRIRYPKHYWPENPLDAEPKIFVKKKTDR